MRLDLRAKHVHLGLDLAALLVLTRVQCLVEYDGLPVRLDCHTLSLVDLRRLVVDVKGQIDLVNFKGVLSH